MTLIAFNTSVDRAVIATDTWSYATDLSYIGRSSKLVHLQHLDAVSAARGDTLFAGTWQHVLHSPGMPTTFDGLVERAPQLLNEWVWDSLPEDCRHDPASCEVFLIGYCTRAESFLAYRFSAARRFTAEPVLDAHCVPMPLSFSIDDGDAAAVRAAWPPRSKQPHAPDVDQFLARWQGRPPMPAPRSQQEWIDLVRLVREQRSEADVRTGFKVIIGGDLWLSSLRRGEFTSRRVHTFDESDHTMAQILAGTRHPMAGPCLCGSGIPSAECIEHQLPRKPSNPPPLDA